jgi:hypothetical protein
MIKETVRYKLHTASVQMRTKSHGKWMTAGFMISGTQPRRDAGAPAWRRGTSIARLVGWEALDASARPENGNKALASLYARHSILLQAAGREKVPALSAISLTIFLHSLPL